MPFILAAFAQVLLFFENSKTVGVAQIRQRDQPHFSSERRVRHPKNLSNIMQGGIPVQMLMFDKRRGEIPRHAYKRRLCYKVPATRFFFMEGVTFRRARRDNTAEPQWMRLLHK